MREMYGIEYWYLAEELNGILSNKRFQKIQKIADGVYRLRFEKNDVICELGKGIYITKYIEETEEADNFIEKVRKELKNWRLVEVKQLNNDRIIEFRFDGFSLIFEMFREGNVILLKDKLMIAVLKKESWAARELKPGKEYLPPPEPPASLEDAISVKPIIVSLFKLSFGREYSEEMLNNCGINERTPGNEIDEKSIAELKKEMEKVKKNAKPYVFLEDDKVVNFGITKFSKYGDSESYKTFSEAADKYYHEAVVVEEEPEEIKKLKRRLEKQEEYLEILKKEEMEFKKMGDWFYENYEFSDKLIKEARELGMNNLEKLKEKYKIKKTDKKKKMIELET